MASSSRLNFFLSTYSDERRVLRVEAMSGATVMHSGVWNEGHWPSREVRWE